MNTSPASAGPPLSADGKPHYALDLGCQSASPESPSPAALVIRVDLESQQQIPGTQFVQADAARLPFRNRSFRTVFCSHSLEHFADLEQSLDEIGRITEPGGSLVVSVPDCRTLTDQVYRWLSRGGGHVNGFGSVHKLATLIQSRTRLKHVATKTLCTSLSFMNRRNARTRLPRRMAIFLWGAEPFLLVLNAGIRVVDRLAGTRASVYGWALQFGTCAEPVTDTPWINVCVRCGRGHASDWLHELRTVYRWGGVVPAYRCPGCGAANFYFRDEDFTALR